MTRHFAAVLVMLVALAIAGCNPVPGSSPGDGSALPRQTDEGGRTSPTIEIPPPID